MPPKTRDEFEMAIICALPVEADAVESSLFDELLSTTTRPATNIPQATRRRKHIYNGTNGDHHRRTMLIYCFLLSLGKAYSFLMLLMLGWILMSTN